MEKQSPKKGGVVSKEMLEKLGNIVQKRGDEDFYVVFSQFDPDAAASAIALAYLIDKNLRAKKAKGKTHVYGSLKVGHLNKVTINKYNLKSLIKPIEELPVDATNIALVDSHKMEDMRLPDSARNHDPLIIIDHHKAENLPEENEGMLWVDANAGSASTLLVELFQEAGIKLQKEDEYIAVLLALGISTDTKDATTSKRDSDALSWAMQYTSESNLLELENPDRPESYFDREQAALENRKREGSRLVTGVGFMPSSAGDDLATIADHLLKMEGITLLVVWGIDKENKRVVGKARSKGFGTILEDTLEEMFGPHSGAKLTPDGRGEGGFSINIDVTMLMPETEKEMVALVKKFMETMVFSEDARLETEESTEEK